MRPPHDWERTHAVIVAVESYAGGPEWDLPGPANDAARMMRWLQARGVPESRMHLLASPLVENEGILASFPGVQRSTADRAHVRRVFQEELRNIDVDWLWVYWAGHGIQAAGNRWSLLYPDTRTGDPLGVDAENLVSLLRTAHLPARRPERVTVVIDACRSALSVGEHARAQPPELITTLPENGSRRVFLMRAARPGEAAKNRERAGLFTSCLMDRLEAGSQLDSTAAPDLVRVWGEVSAEFDRMNSAAGGGQTPTVFLRDWDDNEISYTPRRPPDALTPQQHLERDRLVLQVEARIAGDPAAAARLAAAVSAETGSPMPCSAGELNGERIVDWCRIRAHGVGTLIHLLAEQTEGGAADAGVMWRGALNLTRGRWLLCGEYDALSGLLAGASPDVARALAVAAGEEAVGAVLSDTGTQDLIDHLEELSVDPPRLPRLLGAVERLAAAVTEPLAGHLRDWTSRCAGRLGAARLSVLHARRAELAELTARGEAGPPHDDRIQIRLSAPTGTSGHRTFQAWSQGRSGGESLATHDVPLPRAEIQRAVDKVLTRHGTAHLTRVEFFLDAADLELDVHRWKIGADEPVVRSIGTDFPVVVRCSEHRLLQREHLWQRRWKQVAGASTDDLHRLSTDLATVTAVHGFLSTREDLPGVVVSAVGNSRAEAFTACLFGGVPVMVWRNGHETEGAEAELGSLLESGSLRSLPDTLRRLRAGCDVEELSPGGRLALLWDDPECPLPRPLDLAAPS